jgi:hypothetical protein
MSVRTIFVAALSASVISLPLFVSQANAAGPADRDASSAPWLGDPADSTNTAAGTTFDPHSFRSVTDCLNAAARKNVPLDRCKR